MKVRIHNINCYLTPIQAVLSTFQETLQDCERNLNSVHITITLFANRLRLEICPDCREIVSLKASFMDFQTFLKCKFVIYSVPSCRLSGLNSTLTYNQLTSVPEALFQGLFKLQSMYVPKCFFQVDDCLISHLQHNKLTSLPEGLFHGLSNLNAVYVFDALLYRLNRLFSYLSFNQLTSIPDSLFHGFSNLYWMFVQVSLLLTYSPFVFSYLNNNQLSSLPDNVFCNLPNLRIL
jgi:hypothetical protein